jgi:hypothetical protein
MRRPDFRASTLGRLVRVFNVPFGILKYPCFEAKREAVMALKTEIPIIKIL